jgi:predicted dehydrogenase
MAAGLDGMIELVSGAFSSKPGVSLKSGIALGLPESRIYSDWEKMIETESRLAEADRPDLICIVTPNYLHYGPVIKAIEAGFNVICDKPLSISVKEALDIKQALLKTGLSFCITHNYSGYPMVKKARELVSSGKLGPIRKVVTEYLQGWLSDKEEEKGNRQAEWRADPAKAGNAGCMADIGTHAFQLTEYITGKKITRLYAQLNRFVEGRLLDDDGNVIINMEDNIKGIITASQVALGEENNIKIRIYGTKGSVSWEQMRPNSLLVRWKDRPFETYRTATGFAATVGPADAHSRLPAGHPEGFIEAFANLYRNFALEISARKEGRKKDPSYDFPGIEDGVRGMKFLDAVVKSSAQESWVSIAD